MPSLAFSKLLAGLHPGASKPAVGPRLNLSYSKHLADLALVSAIADRVGVSFIYYLSVHDSWERESVQKIAFNVDFFEF